MCPEVRVRLGHLVFAPAFVLGAVAARVETTQCTPVTSLPAVITVQGVYCLTGDLNTFMMSGSVIEIATNNVVLDLNGHKIGGLAAGTGTTAIGIRADKRQNIRIKNGTIRGFYGGIALYDREPYDILTLTSQGHVIEDIRADRNTAAGIFATGRGVIVRNNLVIATGGSTAYGPNLPSYAIIVKGPGHRVLNNDIVTVTPTGSGSSYGIYLTNVPDALVARNRITSVQHGIYFYDSTGRYWANKSNGVQFPFTGGIDAGNNN